MRIQAALPTIVVMAACVLSPAVGYAQSSPSAEQIVKSLTPTSTHGATRGIRVGSTPPAQVPSTATDAPAVSLTVQFATASADLTPQAMQVLNQLGRALTDRSLVTYRFRIEGHTDTVGTSEQNKALSDRRAAAVVDYLADKFHVDRSRVQAVGMGKDGLLIPTGDQTPEPRNRRVQVVNLGS
jgi:outer membrane protein OmpA-like peptidoglycan-associated protein